MTETHEIYDIERLPEINFFSEVDPGISNEWDLFWLMPEKKKVEYFEVAPDFRKNKIRFLIESRNVNSKTDNLTTCQKTEELI